MDVDEIKISPTGGEVEVEVIFGHAQVGTYKCFLYDPQGQNPRLIRQGTNIDQIVDRFPVGEPAATLPQRILSWETIIQAPASGSGQLYSLTIMVRQDGKVCPGGIIQQADKFPNGTATPFGFRRFVAS